MVILLVVALTLTIGAMPYVYSAGRERGYRDGYRDGVDTNPFARIQRSLMKMRADLGHIVSTQKEA